MELDEVPAEKYQLQDHGGVEVGDPEAVDPADGGLRLPERADGEYAKEAGGGYPVGGGHNQVLRC